MTDLVTFTRKGSKDPQTYSRFRLDEDTIPKQLDISAYLAHLEEKKSQEFDAPKDHFYDMIYDIAGDTFRMCGPEEWTIRHKRPQKFGGTKEDNLTVCTYKRAEQAE